MSHLALSWTIGKGTEAKGGHHPLVDWVGLESILCAVRDKCGTVTLDVVEHDCGPLVLQLFSDHGKFLIMLGDEDEDDYDVRTYTNTSPGKEMIAVLGNYWDPSMICTDFDVVLKAFKEFVETGNVSRDLLK